MHNVCEVVETAEVNVNVTFGVTVIVPFKVAVPHPPVVVTVYVNGDPDVIVGVPEIVTVEPDIVAVTPVGKPITVAPVAPFANE